MNIQEMIYRLISGIFLLLILACVAGCASRKDTKQRLYIPTDTLTQQYSKVYREGFCGDLPLVRMVSFEYSSDDHLNVTCRFSSSLDEGPLLDSINIITDEYKLSYAASSTSKKYEESKELELRSRNVSTIFWGRRTFIGDIINAFRKPTRIFNEEQYWNELFFYLEPEDTYILQKTSYFYLNVFTKDCVFSIHPSTEQEETLKTFLKNRDSKSLR